jgi:hypothetical protein
MATKSGGVLLVLVALGGLSTQALAQGGNSNPGIVPPDARYRGLTYDEWGAKWWQAAFAVPVVNGDHPLISGGSFGGDDGVVFLSAVVGSPATVEVTIPSGTALLVPVVNTECSVLEPDPFHGDDEAELRACAEGHIDNTSGLSASLDGRAIGNLSAYRAGSPLFEFGPLPEDNLFAFFGLDAPEGTTSPSVDAGVYLLLTPLSVGDHKLTVRGTFDDAGVSIDTTFIITVVPRGRS